MNELKLKYGCNPNQPEAKIYMADGSDLPIKILNGRPGYINFLDAFNAWQLVKELKEATGTAPKIIPSLSWIPKVVQPCSTAFIAYST